MHLLLIRSNENNKYSFDKPVAQVPTDLGQKPRPAPQAQRPRQSATQGPLPEPEGSSRPPQRSLDLTQFS